MEDPSRSISRQGQTSGQLLAQDVKAQRWNAQHDDENDQDPGDELGDREVCSFCVAVITKVGVSAEQSRAEQNNGKSAKQALESPNLRPPIYRPPATFAVAATVTLVPIESREPLLTDLGKLAPRVHCRERGVEVVEAEIPKVFHVPVHLVGVVAAPGQRV